MITKQHRQVQIAMGWVGWGITSKWHSLSLKVPRSNAEQPVDPRRLLVCSAGPRQRRLVETESAKDL
jgi:hypothetical protein